MEYYFNILTQDLILIIIHKCKNKKALKRICEITLKAFKRYENLLTSGDIKPNLKLYYFKWYVPGFCQLEINSKNVNTNDLDDILEELLGSTGYKHAYHLNHYSNYLSITYKTQFSGKLIEIFKRNDIDLAGVVTGCDIFIFININAMWRNGSGWTTITFGRDWKLFWKAELGSRIREIIIASALNDV